MVTTENISNTALIKYRFGIVLLWLGILTWLPFILLRIVGETPSLFWFLPFHLAGVIGGSRLRKVARKDMNLPPPQRSRLQMLGHGFILAGISRLPCLLKRSNLYGLL